MVWYYGLELNLELTLRALRLKQKVQPISNVLITF